MTDAIVEAVAEVLGHHFAALVSRNNQPDMSGDPRARLLPHIRRVFDTACIEAARAAIAAYEREGWRPIAEAPTDYTHVLGRDAEGRIFETWFFAPSSTTRDWLKVPGGGKWNPTHFRPLPSPPQEGQ